MGKFRAACHFARAMNDFNVHSGLTAAVRSALTPSVLQRQAINAPLQQVQDLSYLAVSVRVSSLLCATLNRFWCAGGIASHHPLHRSLAWQPSTHQLGARKMQRSRR